MAGLHFGMWRRAEKPIYPVFCFRSDRCGLPLGLVGDAGHGRSRSGLAVGGELRAVPCVGHPRSEFALAFFLWPQDEYDGIRAEAAVHALGVSGGDGIAAGLPGGATEAPARGEGWSNPYAGAGARGLRVDRNSAADRS